MNPNQPNRLMKDSELLKRAFKYIKPHYKSFLLAFLLLVINVGLNILLPTLISSSADVLRQETINFNHVLLIAFTYLLLSLINVVFTFLQSIILQKTGQEIVLKLRQDVFEHIESLSLSQFNDIPVGKLVTRVTNDTIAVSDMFSTLIVNLLKNSLTVIITFVILFVVSWKLTLYMLIFVFFVALFSIIFRTVVTKVFRKEREELSLMNAFISENVSGMKVTQVFNQEERKKKEFDIRNKELRKASFNVTKAFAFYRPSISLLYILAQTTLFAIGIPLVEQGGSFTAPVFLLFYLYLGNFFEPIQALSDLLNGFQRGFSATERIFLLLDEMPHVQDEEDAIEIDGFKGEIVFDKVWFAYTENNWILKDVSFKVEAGKTCAFVGKTGAGKTTILSLIVRNYDIQKGHIYIDGIDIKKIKIESLRKHIGQMLQDVFLFSGTVNSNIKLKNEDITDEEVKKVCKYVNADRFIEKLSNKYNEEVVEFGSNFSTGERQLLSFARTIIRNPSIMILDEATANIDTETELLIQESLEKMKSIGTMLIVAHRLSTIRNSDKIIVLEDGRIIEEGNHESLIELGGYYYNLLKVA